jgi:hypothetical protein
MIMKDHWKNLGLFQKIVFGISVIGIAHFILAMVCWISVFVGALIMRFKGQSIDWNGLWPSLITFVLLGFFFLSAFLAWKSKNAAALLLCISIILSIICFTYEAKKERWQILRMTDKGCKHSYCNWPLYDGPN